MVELLLARHKLAAVAGLDSLWMKRLSFENKV